MPDLPAVVVLCPTRENPEGAAEMTRSFHLTATRPCSEVILVVDEDDPRLAEYWELGETMMVVPGGSLTKATNEAVVQVWDRDIIIGHVGDDHNFKTPGWDAAILEALVEAPGVAYCYDGFPTYWASMWFTNAIVPRTLGWLALPGTYHLAIDDVFMDIGAALGRLHYLGGFTIQHKHPMSGLVPERPIVASHYTKAKREHEANVYHTYLAEQFDADMVKLARVLDIPVIGYSNQPGKDYRKALHFRLHPPKINRRTTRPETIVR